jgi:hypothetical protein
MDKTRFLLLQAQMPKSFWAEALHAANFLRNATYTNTVKSTPEHLFHGSKTSSDRFMVFGCLVYSHVPKEKRHKLDSLSEPGIFGGYDRDSKAWRVLTLCNGEWMYHVSRDVKFLEDTPGYPHLVGKQLNGGDDTDFEIDLPDIVPAVHERPDCWIGKY